MTGTGGDRMRVADDGMAVAVVQIPVDDASRGVARAARAAYRSGPSLDRATAAAAAVPDVDGADVAAPTLDGDVLIVTPERRSALVDHHLGILRDLTSASATRGPGPDAASP